MKARKIAATQTPTIILRSEVAVAVGEAVGVAVGVNIFVAVGIGVAANDTLMTEN